MRLIGLICEVFVINSLNKFTCAFVKYYVLQVYPYNLLLKSREIKNCLQLYNINKFKLRYSHLMKQNMLCFFSSIFNLICCRRRIAHFEGISEFKNLKIICYLKLIKMLIKNLRNMVRSKRGIFFIGSTNFWKRSDFTIWRIINRRAKRGDSDSPGWKRSRDDNCRRFRASHI